VQGAGTVGTKLAITVTQNHHGFTTGSVIRWNSGKDGVTAGYKEAKADSAYNAEVLGVVSEVLSANSFELTMSGIIKMNSMFSNTTGTIPAGFTSDDVYFLSGYTAGWMDVERPTTPGWVAKPVITRLAEDTAGNIFGMVTNYVGSLLGGNVATSLGQIVPVGTVQSFLGQYNRVPAGWALCDGEGNKDNNGVPGLQITKYTEYYNTVGLQYGWVECLKTDNVGLQSGDRIQQQVDSVHLNGVVVGASGGIEEDGKRYIFVRQSINDVDLESFDYADSNQNFLVHVPNSTDKIKGYNHHQGSGWGGQDPTGQEGGYYVIANRQGFEHFRYQSNGSSITIIKEDGEVETGALLYSDSSSKVGVWSVLPPDLRNRFIYGGFDESSDLSPYDTIQTRGMVGGAESFSTNFEEQTGAGGESNHLTSATDSARYKRQSVMPPFVTTNFIVRIDPNASAAIIDLLSIKDLKLTDLPSSTSGEDQYTVYNDNGTLKIVQ
tara:strand:- start:453 stop:1928 length:1476 start_codon:yes stop_codon:yes gene_type:complete